LIPPTTSDWTVSRIRLLGTRPNPWQAMRIMRHSDIKLTVKTYTDEGQLPLQAALGKLASLQGSIPRGRVDRHTTRHTPRHTACSPDGSFGVTGSQRERGDRGCIGPS
jgi:hypothetical protein